jgi:hypothetical protein
MSSMKSMTFHDMSRLMDDFFYLFQRGGRNAQLMQSGGGFVGDSVLFIIKWVLIIIKFFAILILIYVIYIIIFRGYPRFLVNITTLAFFHKENLDALVRDGNLIVKHLKFLSRGEWVQMYNKLFPDQTVAFKAARQFERVKENDYPKYKLDDKYYQALKEFYLYFDRVNEKYATKHELKKLRGHVLKYVEASTGKHVEYSVYYYRFYKLLMTQKIRTGEMSAINIGAGTKKGDDELIVDLYKQDEANGFKERNRILQVKKILIQLGGAVCKMNNEFLRYPIISYIVVPEDNDVIRDFVKNMAKYNAKVQDGSIYELPYSTLSDFTWYMIEYLTRKPYDQLKSMLENIPRNVDPSLIPYYLNLTRTQKIEAQKRAFSVKGNEAFFEFINKRPIFSHIYFAQSVSNPPASSCPRIDSFTYDEIVDVPIDYGKLLDGQAEYSTRMKVDANKKTNKKQFGESFVNYDGDNVIEHFATRQDKEITVIQDPSPDYNDSSDSQKATLYGKVMLAYDTITPLASDLRNPSKITTSLVMMQEKGNILKQMVLAAAYLHMFLNVFRPDITYQYEKQYVTLDEFFWTMFTPFYNDFLVNRIQYQAIQVFSWKNFGNCYTKKFRPFYKSIGNKLTALIKSTYKAFWTGNAVGTPSKSKPENKVEQE